MYRIFFFSLILSCSSAMKKPISQDYPEPLQTTNSENELQVADKEKSLDWKKFFTQQPKERLDNKSGEVLENQTAASDPKIDSILEMLRNNQKNKAEIAAVDLLSTNPSNKNFILLYARILISQKRFGESKILLERNKNLFIGDQQKDLNLFIDFSILRSRIHLLSGQTKNARDTLTQIINAYPSHTKPYVVLANTYKESSYLDQALFILKKGYAQSPKDPALLNAMGEVFEQQEKEEEALSYFNKSAVARNDYLPALINIARSHLRKNNLASAKKRIVQVLSLDPQNQEGRILNAILEAKKGDNSFARLEFESLLEVRPDDPFLRFNLALLYTRDKTHQAKAQSLLEEVITLAGHGSSLAEKAQRIKILNLSNFYL